MADADLLGLGAHCAVSHCSQLDFLPFKCDCCHKTYCLDHRGYAAHSCPAAGDRSTEVIVCPLCAKGVKMNGRDPNVVFEEHQREGCDPTNYAKVHKKPRCPARGCKEKLSTINTYHCRSCNQRVCLKHRDTEDHACAEARALAAAQRGTGALGFLDRVKQALPTTTATAAAASNRSSSTPGLRPEAAQPARPNSAQQARASAMQQYADPSNSVQGTAARRRMEGAPMVTNPVHASSNANPLVAPHLPEICPQCNARFATVERLITHVHDYHPDPNTSTGGFLPPNNLNHQQPYRSQLPGPLAQAGSAMTAAYNSGAQALASVAASVSGQFQNPTVGVPGPNTARSTGESFRCPHCEQVFVDAVVLVGHVEGCAAAHAAGRPVAATGRGQDCCVS